jgi:hypothetical protein
MIMSRMLRAVGGSALLFAFLGLSACASQSKSSTDSSTSTTPVKAPSGTVVIDETQIMWIVGGDIGGGTLEYKGQSYKFKMDGLKLGGFGVHKVKLDGDVYDLNNIDDFFGTYAEAEVGFTVADAGKGDAWFKNDRGVHLRLKSPEAKGLALDVGVDGIDIRRK